MGSNPTAPTKKKEKVHVSRWNYIVSMDQDLIEKFVTITDTGLAPERYRRWAALVMIAATLDRRVWTSIRPGMPLYPNLFVLLVAKPGVGKTMAILPARAAIETQAQVGLSPDSITHERFVELLSERAMVLDPEEEMPTHRSTMTLMLSEWGTFLRTPDNDDLAMLAQIYDCGDYSAETIGRGLDNAENLYVNIIAACTPAWFADGFPPNSYEQGLPTRMHFIYSEEVASEAQPDFEFSQDPLITGTTIADKLYLDLDKISKLRGFVRWTREAGEYFNDWKKRDFAPKPTDPLLQGYNARRALHAAKIALLVSVARHPEQLEIRLDDLKRALEILFEAEPFMSKALSAAGGNIYQLRAESIAGFVEARYLETKKPVPEWEVRQRLGKLVPPNMLRTIIDEMIAAQTIRTIAGTKAPNRKLSPGVTR